MSSFNRLKPASLAILFAAAASASASPTALVLSGTTAPGTGGGTFSAFTNPVLNSNGEVAFQASVANGTSTSGVFTGTATSVSAVALQGTATPAGGIFGSFYASATSTSVTLNSSGTVAFTATGITGGTSTSGIFMGTSAATLTAAALQGTAAPSGGNYNAFLANGTNQAYSPVLNNAGELAIQSTLTGGSAAAGVFAGAQGALQTVAVVGGPAPSPSTGNYATTVTVPTINASGQVAFVSLAALNGTNEQGIFAGLPGATQTVMLQGTTAPGTGGALYGTPTTTYSYNNAGQVGFITTLTAGPTTPASTSGVFLGAPGAVQPLALNNTVAPGGSGGTFTTFSNVTVNGMGQAAFGSTLTGGTAASGLFYGSSTSNVQAVALAGGTSPDGATYASFASPEYTNAPGEVAFTANLTGTGVTAGTNSVELIAGMPGNLVELVRQGDTVDGMTVSGFGLLTGSGGQDGKGITFDDNGDIVYRLTFTNGVSGIFESTVPEPTSLSLIAAGAGMLLRQNRRRLAETA